MDLTSSDLATLKGERGEAAQLAMELLVVVGRASAAPHLIDIESAHIDGCLFHGRAGLEFAERLSNSGGVVKVPTTLNVSSLDLLHPNLYRGDETTAILARRLMDAYVEMGCTATWTCAPYQLASRPAFGSQIAWGESNAIVFANSVLGARTNRYGDFTDICCALTGRAPFSGLHTDLGRLATLNIEVRIPDRLLDMDLTYPLIGHVLGQLAGSQVAVLTGLDDRAGEDRLKAIGAAAASSGAVGMFHVVGVTPEARDLESAVGDNDLETTVLDLESLEQAHVELGADGGVVGAVSVGTPHMSLSELTRLAGLLTGSSSRIPFYVNTARDTLASAADLGLVETIEAFGATFVTDTCTYVTAIIGDVNGKLMTDSGKLAYYAPANLGLDVTIASLGDCVASAVAGTVRTTSLRA